MKKTVAMFLILLLLTGCASAVTVSEFVERYNQDIGDGFRAVLWDEYISKDVWFLSASDQRNVVAVMFDPDSADDPRDCTVTAVCLKHKPRVSVGVFINNIAAALAATFPEIPEEERLAEALRCLRTGDKVFGTGYFQDDPIPYNTEHMGQFVYQEEDSYHTFLYSLSEKETE